MFQLNAFFEIQTVIHTAGYSWKGACKVSHRYLSQRSWIESEGPILDDNFVCRSLSLGSWKISGGNTIDKQKNRFGNTPCGDIKQLNTNTTFACRHFL